ncbi:MAG: VPLPA-CTERM sorting domain-containing protein [Smithella sp.]|jgi:hypothetical protein
MKKTLFTILTIAMLLVGVAGQAMAYFEQGHLVRVVYDRGGVNEILTDMGGGFDYTSPSNINSKITDNPFDIADLGLADYSNVYVSYFILKTYGVSGVNSLWLSGPNGGQTSRYGAWSSTGAATVSLIGINHMTGNAQNVYSQHVMSSYADYINAGDFGTMMTFISNGNMEQNLGSFNAEGSQYVDQYLYYYAPNIVTGKPGLKVAQIRTYEGGTTGGTTEINPVPVPAAVYLLGSGLLALVGIRRKTNLEA